MVESAQTNPLNPSLLSFSGVSLGYDGHVVLEGLNFAINKGDYLGLVGPNGAGKTTLLKAIIGSLKPLSGQISRAKAHDNTLLRFGYMPQHQSLEVSFPLTVRDVVMMGRYRRMGWRIRANAEDRAICDRCLERVKMLELAQRHIGDLSGGQQQRVLMARALACEPQLLLLDEPTNGMDLAATQDTMAIINDLHQQGLTVVIVTHLLELVADNCSTVGLIVNHEQEPNSLHIDSVSCALNSQYLSKIFGRPVSFRSQPSHKSVPELQEESPSQATKA